MEYFKSLDRDQLIYTPFYCEENIWKFCEKIQQEQPELLENCFVVFISNHRKQALLWAQRIGDKNHDYYVIWDYHVILVYQHLSGRSNTAIVFDFDTIMPFPCNFDIYQKNVLQRDKNIDSKYDCLFRVIKAKEYLNTFASDRSRMKDHNGHFIQPPPKYPCIKTSTDTNNLNDFISMAKTKFHVGEVINLDQFRQMFSK